MMQKFLARADWPEQTGPSRSSRASIRIGLWAEVRLILETQTQLRRRADEKFRVPHYAELRN